jgi:hypothetical protein
MAATQCPHAPRRFGDARALRTLRRLLAALLPADDAGGDLAGAARPPGARRAARCALFAAWLPARRPMSAWVHAQYEAAQVRLHSMAVMMFSYVPRV